MKMIAALHTASHRIEPIKRVTSSWYLSKIKVFIILECGAVSAPSGRSQSLYPLMAKLANNSEFVEQLLSWDRRK